MPLLQGRAHSCCNMPAAYVGIPVGQQATSAAVTRSPTVKCFTRRMQKTRASVHPTHSHQLNQPLTLWKAAVMLKILCRQHCTATDAPSTSPLVAVGDSCSPTTATLIILHNMHQWTVPPSAMPCACSTLQHQHPHLPNMTLGTLLLQAHCSTRAAAGMCCCCQWLRR